MNPAALKTNLARPAQGRHPDRQRRRLREERPARWRATTTNPLDAEVLEHTYQLFKVPMTKIVREALKDIGHEPEGSRSLQELLRAGPGVLALRPRPGADAPVPQREVRATSRRSSKPTCRPCKAGWNYGETTDAFASSYKVDQAKLPPGKYSNIMGNEALAWGLMTAAKLSGKELFLGTLSDHAGQRHSARTVASSRTSACARSRPKTKSPRSARRSARPTAAHMAITTSSGPGIALKGEAIGLAVMLELPLLDHQRSARRPEHRPADEDRAGRPVPGDSRPQRRMPDAGHRRPQPGRLLRRGAGSLADRHAVHDARSWSCPTATSPTAASRG